MINPLLPDEEASKVNLCVENIFRIWDEGKADKLTQLVFSDLSTPKTGTAKSDDTAKNTVNGTEIHALEMMDDTPTDSVKSDFTVYDDIRQKLISRGVPAEEIAFIHDANTEAKKKELFAKVRSGNVRVLIGSTFKMGAGTNVQDRLVALHDLDCPWRPGDLEQRKGRIVRQGNKNKQVQIYRYVTDSTFDAYLYQTVETKQKFISQIMTSKSPVRSCEDIDETALSYAEIKALCAGDPRIKERMDLDVDVSRLKLMKADHQNQQYRLEDNLLRNFPEQIKQCETYIAGYEADMQTVAAHPLPKEGFVGMEIRGELLTDKEKAGAALLDACKSVKVNETAEVGHYRGFALAAKFDPFEQGYTLTLKGQMSHTLELGSDAKGNLTRIENEIARIPAKMNGVQAKIENLKKQTEAAKAEVGKPFPHEEELHVKSARLIELTAELDMDRKPEEQTEEKRPSVLAKLRSIQPPDIPREQTQPKNHTREVR